LSRTASGATAARAREITVSRSAENAVVEKPASASADNNKNIFLIVSRKIEFPLRERKHAARRFPLTFQVIKHTPSQKMKNKESDPNRTHCRTPEMKRKLILRLRRIDGQLRTLQQWIEDDRACVEILRLSASVSGALRGVWTEVLNDHLRGCIRESLEHKDTRKLDELIELLRKNK